MNSIIPILLLAVLEVSLSFDNAVVNASVLKKMNERWQKIFLTWGILIAVFGVRLVLPTLIVAASAGISIREVVHMVIYAPADYSQYMQSAHANIAAFGGAFLLLVFLGFACDKEKDSHWLEWPERHLSRLGAMESVEIVITLIALLISGAPLIAGLLGIITFFVMKGMADKIAGTSVAASGIAGFLYLEVLDASFSLDGVIGAFAITDKIVIIMVGLGIGAFAIRSLTIRLVRKGTLDELVYLEHGAHWGIGALAGLMLLSMTYHISEPITGLIGVAFIAASWLSSLRKRKNG